MAVPVFQVLDVHHPGRADLRHGLRRRQRWRKIVDGALSFSLLTRPRVGLTHSFVNYFVNGSFLLSAKETFVLVTTKIFRFKAVFTFLVVTLFPFTII